MSENNTDGVEAVKDVADATSGRVALPDRDELVAVAPEGAEGRISVQDLINRCHVQANTFGERSVTRLLLFNVSRALVELSVRLYAAEETLRKVAEDEAAHSDAASPVAPESGG